jgi:hypothetical protein
MDKTAKSSVGVIIEAKKPTNKAEMITTKKLNAKAFQELVLYYLRERITHKNLEVKHLVATNINEWFIFDATLFDRLFAQNKNFVKQFKTLKEDVWQTQKPIFSTNKLPSLLLQTSPQKLNLHTSIFRIIKNHFAMLTRQTTIR